MVSGEGFRRRKLETFNIHVHVTGIILEYPSRAREMYEFEFEGAARGPEHEYIRIKWSGKHHLISFDESMTSINNKYYFNQQSTQRID